MVDSTGNGSDGSSNGSMTSGDSVNANISDGLDTDGSDDFINHGSASAIDDLCSNNDATFSVWFKTSDSSNKICLFCNRGENAEGYWGHLDSGNAVFTIGRTSAGSTSSVTSSGTDFGNGSFHNYVATYDISANDAELFIDAISEASNASMGDTNVDNSMDHYVGALGNNATNDTDGEAWQWPGILDEVRISKTILSDNWISTEYNNQSDSTFWTVGSEQDVVTDTPGSTLESDGNGVLVSDGSGVLKTD